MCTYVCLWYVCGVYGVFGVSVFCVCVYVFACVCGVYVWRACLWCLWCVSVYVCLLQSPTYAN